MSFESKIETFCNIITATKSEDWDKRNNAVLNLTKLISECDVEETSKIQDLFNSNVFKLLKDPIKDLISDLRSQQTRDVCLFLQKLSAVTKDHMRILLREIFQDILNGIKVPNYIMSSYVHETILILIKNCTFKTCLPLLLSEIKVNKAKLVREKCLEYIIEILINWEGMNDKETDIISEAIKVALSDAACTCRENARMAYLNLSLAFKEKADRIKANADKNLRKQLEQSELKYLPPTSAIVPEQAKQVSQESAVKKTAKKNDKKNKEDKSKDESYKNNRNYKCVDNKTTNDEDDNYDAFDENVMIISPVKTANLRNRRMTIEDSAVAVLQAVIRGRKCRRGSISMKIPSDLDYDNDSNKENLKISQGKDECINYEKDSIISNIITIEPFENGSNIDIINKSQMINLLKKKYLNTLETLNEQISIIEKLENNDFEKFIHKNFKNENKNENNKIVKKYLNENIIQHCLSLNDNEINVNQIFRDNFRKLL